MTESTPRASWMKRALILSVALNVAAAAAVLGALATGGPDRREGARRGGPPEIAALARGLDDDARRALFERLRADGAIGGMRAAMTQARGAVSSALRAEPFDRPAFESTMRAQGRLRADMADRGLSVLSEVIAGLPAAERAALAERMERRGGPRR